MSLASILARLRGLPEIASWPEALAYVARAVHREGHSPWEYPVAACRSVGGGDEQSLPGAAAVFCALAGIHLVDDLLDEDPAGDYRRIGPGRAANLGLALQAAGHLLLDAAACDIETRAPLHARYARMALLTARGQELDAEEAADEAGYWQRVEAKTPPLFAAALELGALLGGGAPAAVEAVGRLGAVMGRYVQVSDDLADALKTPASADWARCRGNLALLYAVTAEHPEREAFLALAAHAAEPAALAEAQEILVRSGAVAYCIYRLTLLAGEARDLLTASPLAAPEPLERLLSAQGEPLAHLLTAAGADPTAALGAR
jgi:geranylgeranyl pyrophosphate synthase